MTDPQSLIGQLKGLLEKATPGPWQVESDTQLVWGPAPDDDTRTWGAPVADACLPRNRGHYRRVSTEEQEANARLIAFLRSYAPQLLALAEQGAEATVGDMAAFGASEAACYLYPGENQQAERAAFCEGARHSAPSRAEARRAAIEECARVRPPRSAGAPPGGSWGGSYQLGWDHAVIAYADRLRSLATSTEKEEG